MTIPEPILPKPINPNVNGDAKISLFCNDLDIVEISNCSTSWNHVSYSVKYQTNIFFIYIFTGTTTSGLSNKVLFFRIGLEWLFWLFDNPRFVSTSGGLLLDWPTFKFKRGFLGLSFFGPLEVDPTGLEGLFLAFTGLCDTDALRALD